MSAGIKIQSLATFHPSPNDAEDIHVVTAYKRKLVRGVIKFMSYSELCLRLLKRVQGWNNSESDGTLHSTRALTEQEYALLGHW